MPNNTLADWSTDPDLNIDVGGVELREDRMRIRQTNDALRNTVAQIAELFNDEVPFTTAQKAAARLNFGALSSGATETSLPYITKSAGVFDVLSYVRNADRVSADAIEAGDVDAQDGDNVLAAVRAAGDAAMAWVQGRTRGKAIIQLPAGILGMKDEFFSDTFQEAWWLQTSLLKGKHIVVQGAGRDNTLIQIRDDYVSGCRNTLNSNERDYGPWDGLPSPSILFPAIASISAGAPASLSLRGLGARGTGRPGRDPIIWYAANALDDKNDDFHATNFANHGQVISGAYNCLHYSEVFENCGLQPVEGGAIMGYAAGFPPPYVRFDITTSGSTVTVTAKAGYDAETYTSGDEVPFFKTDHVGRQFLLASAATAAGANFICRLEIATVASDGVSTATMTLPAGITGRASAAGLAGSFLPVQATTTASSADVSLSDVVLFGRGEQDMLGHLIAIPKGGGTGHASHDYYQDNDVLVSRLASVSSGSDADGYAEVALGDVARLTATDHFLTGIGHAAMCEETLFQLNPFSFNDCDFVQCRWEHSGGYGIDPNTGSCQFLLSGMGGSVNYVACKAHGANPVRGNFGADAQFILDNINWIDISGMSFTHSCWGPKGAIRMMGGYGRVSLSNPQIGSWQLPPDFAAIYVEPEAGYSPLRWDARVDGPEKLTAVFRVNGLSREYIKGSMSRAALAGLVSGEARINWRLSSSDDLDHALAPGLYEWGSSAPANGPTFGTYGIMQVFAKRDYDGTGVIQLVHDLDSQVSWRRIKFGASFTRWSPADGRLEAFTSADIASATSAANTQFKAQGKPVLITSDLSVAVANGAASTSSWNKVARDSGITPA